MQSLQPKTAPEQTVLADGHQTPLGSRKASGCCCLLTRFAPFILALGLIAGCATSEPKYAALNDGSGLEKKQAAPTDSMTTGEKTAYYLGWFSLVGLYGWGQHHVDVNYYEDRGVSHQNAERAASEGEFFEQSHEEAGDHP